MALQRREVSFHRHDSVRVADEMEELAGRSDGDRWVNIEPDVDESQIHTGSVFWRMFSSRGPVIPKLTWLPAHEVKGRRRHTEVGLTHATGAEAVPRLERAGVSVPEGWVTVQDHTRRGILFAVPDGDDVRNVISLAVDAIAVLSPFDFEGYYLATFWER
jgi:hypothetical protein